MKTHVLIPLCLILSLTACAKERVVLKPEIVEVVRVERIGVPADLTRQLDLQRIPDQATYGDLIGILAEERKTVQTLNGRLAAIESLGESDDGD